MSSNRMDTQLQGITDLTLLTPIKPGFVEAYETVTHVERLRSVLRTLNALRLGSRESTNPPSPYTDVVSRFRIVHSFRWAVIDPAPGSNEPARLLLNVNFDGGWEPYMRVIWRDLGTLLDIILCHSASYKLSVDTSFERYAQWVRDSEVPADFLFIESGRSVSDHEYLAAQEALERSTEKPDALAATQLRTPSPGYSPALPEEHDPAKAMAVRGITPLAGLFLLNRYFNTAAPDGWCLLRATRDILFELVKLDTAKLFPPEDPIRKQYFQQLAWLETVPPEVPVDARELGYLPTQIQGGMLTGYPNLSNGALLMLHVDDAALALQWLAKFNPSTEAEGRAGHTREDGYYRNLSLSLAGLAALGAGPSILARFPQPFREGMEARAGVLGDLRHNHPKYWIPPARNWPRKSAIEPSALHGDGGPIDLSSVHVLVQLRQARKSAETLVEAIQDLMAGSGMRVLAVEEMRRNAGDDNVTRENFGFMDGISQPAAADITQDGNDSGKGSGEYWSDDVPRGDLLLGYRTSRDKYTVPELADALLDNGSFMVVRKLRQRVGLLNRTLDACAEAHGHGLTRRTLLGKLMGRSLDGLPLAHAAADGPTNDFNYAQDDKGSQCPFHAHIRRANPRDLGVSGAMRPRLLRRGMSYGTRYDPKTLEESDHGLYFIAYNANIAEQFETIQRWIAGGNSSGGYSGQSDPFMSVAVPGQPRIIRIEIDGKAVNVNLGDKPFTELQWGGYYFVPSMAALKNLGKLLTEPAAAPAQPRAPDVTDSEGWRVWLEDTNTRDAAWAYVRSQAGGVLRTAYGVLVGDAKLVQQVFRNSPDHYSVRGYGERMQDSIGLGYLGLDADTGHTEQAPLVNQAIEKISEQEAFGAAYVTAKVGLSTLLPNSRQLGLAEATLDLEQLSLGVLAQLCSAWFGLPDAERKFMWGTEYQPTETPTTTSPPRCPRDLLYVSRHVFGPHPSPLVDQMGRTGGASMQAAFKAWLASGPNLSRLPLVSATLDAVKDLKAAGDATIEERTLAGIMLGFPPTVHGNLLGALMGWNQNKKLWTLQLDWPTFLPATQAEAETAAPDAYKRARTTLSGPLAAALMSSPVPAQVWRYAKGVPHKLGEVTVVENDLVVVGIASATQQAGCSHYIPFGGQRDDEIKPPPLHACPGYAMAMGVMQGVIAAVLELGTLRATSAPMVLTVPLH